MSEANVTLTINVGEDFLDALAEAMAKANLRAGGLLPGSPATPDAPVSSQPLHRAPETTFLAPGTTPSSGADDPWKAPAVDPFADTKAAPADPWATDPLADAIGCVLSEAALTELYHANKAAWTETHTNLAKTRKEELSK